MNATTTHRPKALLLDDDPIVLRLLATALEARGFDVRAATTAESGLELLLEELLDLDVLVADADLPGRDGVSLVHLVRGAGGERELGVVVLTSSASRGARAQLLALGADAVVDRALGHEAVCGVVADVAARPSGPARAFLGGARPAVRGALLVARAALSPAPRLAGAAA